MAKLFTSSIARVFGAAMAAAAVAAVVVTVAPSVVPEALAQGPGSTVPPIGEGIRNFLAAIFEFIRSLFGGWFR